MDLVETASMARDCQLILARAGTVQKNKALDEMAGLLDAERDRIKAENGKDLANAASSGLDKKLVDRLLFDDGRIDSRVKALGAIKDLEDPVGDTSPMEKMPSGLLVGRMRVPVGVIGMIFESRPHVTVNAGALCLKSGNSVILRGGSEVINTNRCLGELWQSALERSGLPSGCIQVVGTTDRAAVRELLSLSGYIDLIIPRGGKSLIETVVETTKIPVIKHLSGICHIYIDESAELNTGLETCFDSKLFAPEVCNAAETVLVDRQIAGSFLPPFTELMRKHGVEVRGCEKSRQIVTGLGEATEEDWHTEYLDLIYSVKIVNGVNEAVEHINSYGSGHTESIISRNLESIRFFIEGTDSGVLLVNASTMYCDGSEIGMGAEIGISTDKIHARGPMGINELTTYKNLVIGSGHCMGNVPELPELK